MKKRNGFCPRDYYLLNRRMICLVLMRKLFLMNLLFVIFLLSCSSEKRMVSHWYGFSDSPSRSIQLAFNADSTFLLMNAVSGNLAFSLSGHWRRISQSTFVLINPNYSNVRGEASPLAYRPGENIDEILAGTNTRYLFPGIQIDTIAFSKHYKGFYFKGYRFIIGSRVRH
ncbi:hypothetical protein [Pararcticibacter amylolyticus]|uniref:hypothetical protein n=1 Tax=Pararcticibacter amylolyticus TaxID=2173175 RepID=UPI0011B21FE7|nr:hypothetical protein [Pararcticibacter amylolyticus]